jgi:bla regulator protein BlaR1
MHVLIEIAIKSLVIAGLALGLLALMKRRSAAERSWVAHIGLSVGKRAALPPVNELVQLKLFGKTRPR